MQMDYEQILQQYQKSLLPCRKHFIQIIEELEDGESKQT